MVGGEVRVVPVRRPERPLVGVAFDTNHIIVPKCAANKFYFNYSSTLECVVMSVGRIASCVAG